MLKSPNYNTIKKVQTTPKGDPHSKKHTQYMHKHL